MTASLTRACTAFAGDHCLAAGPLVEVALAIRAAAAGGAGATLLAFDDATGKVVDLDLRGSKADLVARLAAVPDSAPALAPAAAPDSAPALAPAEADAAQRGRGRPKLGVVAREVTLLPRHWDWLSAQPGGASVVLRRLVEEARRAGAPHQQARAAQAAAYAFMAAMAGDRPGFEEASRALFAGDRPRLEQEAVAWPADIRAYALRLAYGAADVAADQDQSTFRAPL